MTSKAAHCRPHSPHLETPKSSRRSSVLTAAHTVYKSFLSPFLHNLASTLGLATHCRFQPTCADYSTLALAQHGLLRGAWLTLRRVGRCHPFSRGGWDPVPPPPPKGV